MSVGTYLSFLRCNTVREQRADSWGRVHRWHHDRNLTVVSTMGRLWRRYCDVAAVAAAKRSRIFHRNLRDLTFCEITNPSVFYLHCLDSCYHLSYPFTSHLDDLRHICPYMKEEEPGGSSRRLLCGVIAYKWCFLAIPQLVSPCQLFETLNRDRTPWRIQ